MFVCLIVGSLLITGVLASIPMYSAGTLRQMLGTDMQAYERTTGKSAGQMFFSGKISDLLIGTARSNKVGEIEERVIGGLKGKSVTLKNHYIQTISSHYTPERNTLDYSNMWSINSVTYLDENVTIVEGRMFGNELNDGAIEVIIEENEWNARQKATLNARYKLSSDHGDVDVIPVGVFRVSDPESPYWYETKTFFSDATFCSPDAFKDYFYTFDTAGGISEVKVYLNLNFANAGMDNLGSFIQYYNELYEYAKTFGSGRNELKLNSSQLINRYLKKTATMQMSLWVLNVPVIAMLAFYMIMVTTMIIEEDRNEISTFKSRGAKTSQIFLRYVVESGFVSVFALILGPPIGFILAKTVGNASGFMEFDSREIMPIKFSFEAFMYAIIACIFFSALILIPALSATRKTIVNLKQRKARKSHRTWWEKCFIDVICLVLAIGLLWIYKRTNGFNVDGTVDPIVYIISTLFILGAGLLFLRIYPYIVALIFAITKRILRPAPYSAFVQVSRGGNDYRFLMLFLIMTISVGIYGSASARIINSNVENTVMYENGADVVINPDFSNNSPYEYNAETGERIHIPETFRQFKLDRYTDADFVTAVSRVGHYENNSVMMNDMGYPIDYPVEIMAIDPYEFGNISWCGTSLNGTNWKNYLNMIEISPTAVLISRDLAEQAEVDVGDVIQVSINGSNTYEGENWPQLRCYVGAVIDYWPTIKPAKTLEGDWDGDGNIDSIPVPNCYIIMNFEYLYSVRDTQEFQIYLAVSDEAKTGIDSFTEIAIKEGVIDDKSQIETYRPDIMHDQKSDSMLKGLNGSYSIGFVSTLTVAFVGFIIYWIMNVRKRKLQFGILRAMGLTKGKLTAMLIYEHLLTTGVSVVIGLLVGALTVKIYTPLLKVAYASQTIPLDIIYNRDDITKILIVVGAMLITGIVVLAVFINKLKINEAVKIGEE